MSKSLLEEIDGRFQPTFNSLMQRLVLLETKIEHIESHLKNPSSFNDAYSNTPLNPNDLDIRTISPWCNQCNSNISNTSMPCCVSQCPMGLYNGP